MEPTRTLPPIAAQLKEYLETKFKLVKYQAVDTASAIIAEVVTDLVIAVLLLLTFIFLSVTLALFAAYLLHSAWEGFGCLTLLYSFIALGVRLLQVPIRNIFIRRMIEKIFRKRN